MILITGATGNIGTPLIEMLKREGISTRALVRDVQKESASVDRMKAGGVEVAAGDLADVTSLNHALAGVTAAFLLTPVDQHQVEWKSNFITAAKNAGVKRIVNLSVAGASPQSPIILGRWHWESEQELQRSGLGWTHLRPYDLAQYNTRMLLATVPQDNAIYSTVGQGAVAMVDERDVASVAMECLRDPKHNGQAYTLTGPQALTYPQIADAIATQLGKPVRYVDITEDAAKASMLKAGVPEWMAGFINDLRTMERNGGASAVTTDITQVTGNPATPYTESLRAVLAS